MGWWWMSGDEPSNADDVPARPKGLGYGSGRIVGRAIVQPGTNVEYYDKLAEVYSLFFDDFERSMEAEGQWLDEILRPEAARTVLDASCGTGRQAIPLARLGYRVTAADPSDAMLREAKQGAVKEGAVLSFVRSSFASLPAVVRPGFDAVIALGNGLCNLRCVEEIEDALTAMLACLRPGGLCLIGVKDFDRIRVERPRFHGRRIRDVDGERAILFEVWDYADPMLVCTAYFMRGAAASWRVQSAGTEEYMLGREEAVRCAYAAGFESVVRVDHPCEVVYAMRKGPGVVRDEAAGIRPL